MKRFSTIMVLFIICLSLFYSKASLSQQILSTFNCTASIGTFTPVAGGTILSTPNPDDGNYPPSPIGFNFLYLGTFYSYFSASTNGTLVLGTSPAMSQAGTAPNSLLSTGTPRPFICPLGDDQYMDAGTFKYTTTGSPGIRVFTAEWLNVRWDYNVSTPSISYQVKFYEATGQIQFIYRQEYGLLSGIYENANIGISAATTGAGNFISLTNASASPVFSLNNETTNIKTKPATGQIYSFSPPLTPGFDIAMKSLNSPAGFIVGNNTINVTVENKRLDTINWFYFGYKLDNNIPTLVSKVFKKLAIGQAYNYTYPVLINVPAAGNHTLKLWVTKPNDSFPDNVRANDTMVINFCVGMSGPYTIGPSGNYASFTAAVTALSSGCGISGPVTFNVQPGTYTERVTIPSINGASATNTITFRGTNKNSVILTYSWATLRSTLYFNGGKYITFENMTIQNTGAAIGRAIFFRNAADSNIISNCNIIVSNSSPGLNIIAIEAGSNESSTLTTGNNANKVIIKNNDISGGYYGILFSGTNSTTLCSSNKIISNTFHDQYMYAINLQYERGMLIQRNTIDIGTRINTAYGIKQNYNQYSVIDGNIIKPGQYGIYLNYENDLSPSDSTVLINNMIHSFKNITNQTGVRCDWYNYNLKFYHNSFSMTDTTANNVANAALFINFFVYNLSIKNNIFATTGSNMMITITPSCPYGNPAEIDYNNYYYPAGNINNMFYNNFVFYKNLVTWKTSTGGLSSNHDLQSYDTVNPNFVSAGDLHLNPLFPVIKGLPLWVQYDADGDTRCSTEATIGADESRFSGIIPTAGFNGDDTLCMGVPAYYTNTAGSTEKKAHSWYVNNILKSNDLNFNYFFSSAGKDTITLITGNCYGKDTFSETIAVDSPAVRPAAEFIASTNYASVGDDITLFDLSAGCPTGWKWAISIPGTYTFKTGYSDSSQNPVLKFNVAGIYTVCLTSRNVRGYSSILCKTNYIVIDNPGVMCNAPFVSTNLSGTLHDDLIGPGYQGPVLNDTCSYFINTCNDTLRLVLNSFEVKTGDYFRVYDNPGIAGKPLWDIIKYSDGLGNGMSMLTPGFQDTFISLTGNMFVEWQRVGHGSVINYNPGGFIAKWSGHLRNPQPPTVANFTCPDTVCADMDVNFINHSTGLNLTFDWSLKPLSPHQTTRNASFTYSSTGIYIVTLTVTGCGGASIFMKTVVVISPNNKPKADFYANKRKPVKAIDIVNFVDSTKGCVDSWEWEIQPSTFTAVSGYPASPVPAILFNDTGCYDVKLIAGYNGNYDTVTKTCYIKPIDYCIPKVSGLHPDLGISLVQFQSISNSTSVGVTAYTDYTATKSTVLEKGATYQLRISRNTSYNLMNRKVWIDYNIDGVFDDPDEMVGFEPAAWTISWTTNITIPRNAKTGLTRMRIGTSLASTPNTPCGTNQYGEFEDYRLIIRPDTTPPVLTMLGKDTIIIPECGGYTDAGATAFDNVNGNLTSVIKITNNLNKHLAGTYWYKYNVSDSNGNKAPEKIRIIIVTPDTIKPVLKVMAALDTMIGVYTAWFEPGCLAYDTCSGLKGTIVITGSVDPNMIGDYPIKYTATDNENNKITITRLVHVRDTASPKILLNGASTMTIPVYGNFVDPGVTYIDDYDLNPILTITGKVDTANIGTYIITYRVIDHSGNGPVTTSRTVKVVDIIAPVVTAPGFNDTLIVEVYDYLYEPILKVTDNYYKTFTTIKHGTYPMNFPSGRAMALGYYTLIYDVTDGSGNTGTINFIVKVIDNEKPVINLLGPVVVYLCRFEVLKPGQDTVTVTDNYYKNLVVHRSGTYFSDYLIYRKNGTYTLIYSVQDGSGNFSNPVARLIVVQDCPGNSISESTTGNILVYPNPNDGRFFVQVETTGSGKTRILIMNLLGEIIREINMDRGNGTYQIELGNIKEGIYLVKVESNELVLVKKITVERK